MQQTCAARRRTHVVQIAQKQIKSAQQLLLSQLLAKHARNLPRSTRMCEGEARGCRRAGIPARHLMQAMRQRSPDFPFH